MQVVVCHSGCIANERFNTNLLDCIRSTPQTFLSVPNFVLCVALTIFKPSACNAARGRITVNDRDSTGGNAVASVCPSVVRLLSL